MGISYILGKEIVMSQVGLVVITSNGAKVLKRYPEATEFFRSMYWLPLSGADLEDGCYPTLEILQWAVDGLITLIPVGENGFGHLESGITMYGDDEALLSAKQPCVWVPAEYARAGNVVFGDICILGSCDDEGRTVLLSLGEAKKLVHPDAWLTPLGAMSTAAKARLNWAVNAKAPSNTEKQNENG
jgi:hypothetical protein